MGIGNWELVTNHNSRTANSRTANSPQCYRQQSTVLSPTDNRLLVLEKETIYLVPTRQYLVPTAQFSCHTFPTYIPIDDEIQLSHNLK
ncbi:MAG: hypothetical protein WBL95_17205 [Microcoleus sp.]